MQLSREPRKVVLLVMGCASVGVSLAIFAIAVAGGYPQALERAAFFAVVGLVALEQAL